jgi:hypothetical protein
MNATEDDGAGVRIAVDGMDERAERSHFLQRRDGGEVTGLDNRLCRANQLDAALGQPARALGHVGVGDDRDQRRRF